MTFSDVSVPLWAVRTFAFVWGCMWGSFINVVIYRVPRAMSVVTPGSHCPACGAPVRPLDNVPVLSWLMLRGRARCCGAPISARYTVVELLGGALGLALAELVLLTVPPHAGAAHAATVFLANFALAMALMAAAFIDAAHMYLPDAITIGGTVFGLATAGLRDMTWRGSLLGAGVGFVIVWLPLVVGYRVLRGREGMGIGDAKLVMLAGAWYGLPGAAFALFAGALQASLGAIGLFLLRGKIEEPQSVREDRAALREAAAQGDAEAAQALKDDPLASEPQEGLMAARLPFGPFLCLAIIEWMLGGDWIREHFVWLRG